MIPVDLALAQRLEAAEARNAVACAEAHQQLNPETGATVMEVAGGFAIFVGADSPLTHAVGLGMRGPVDAEDIQRLDDFYGTRGAVVAIEICPLADPSLLRLLVERGYHTVETNTVLVRPSDTTAYPPGDLVRLAYPDEAYLWARTVGRGFLEKDELTPEEIDIGSAIWNMTGSRCYFAFGGGRAAAAGAMTIHDGLANLFADSTLLGFRGAGLQSALIRERLRVAAAEHSDLATAATLPASVSQRNYERHGFQVAYTRTALFCR